MELKWIFGPLGNEIPRPSLASLNPACSCLFGEMFGKRQPILPSRPPTSANQLELIYQLCGTPTGEAEARLSRCDGWEKYPSSTPHAPKLREKYLTIMPPAGIDLLEKLLCLNPDEVGVVFSHSVRLSFFVSESPQREPSIILSSIVMVELCPRIDCHGSQTSWRISMSLTFRRRRLKMTLPSEHSKQKFSK
jgi:hypothetical protein